MRRIMLFAAFLLATHVPATASAEQPVYPPEGCYLVKGVAVNDGRAGNHNVTYRVAEVLCGPADLKDRYFLARFADISRNEEACILGNLSRTRRGEETYHWITLGIGPDGPLAKDIRFDSVREGDARPDGTFRSSKACFGRHVSLTFATGGSISHPQLGDLVPVPHKFPTTGPLWPDVQKRVDDLRAAGKDPYKSTHELGRQFFIPPPKKETEEWMAALKEFGNTRDVAARERLLEKYIDSKNEPLKEWAEFVIKNYGWKSKAPVYEGKK